MKLSGRAYPGASLKAVLGLMKGSLCQSYGMSTAQGSAGNVLAALASFFVPGLGQLLQGRVLKALIMFLLAGVLWWFLLGWIIHLWSIIDAALFKRPVGR